MDTVQRFSKTTVLLHWLVGLAVIAMIAIGFYMTTTRELWLLPYHKSIGVIIFVVAVVRIGWRYKVGWPPAVSQYTYFERVVAKLIHWILILGTIGLPLSGMLDSAASGYGFGIFGWELFPENLSAEGKVVARNSFLGNAGDLAHEVGAYVMAAAITLHVLGAVKHHVMDKDRTLARMLGR